jgi:hypothetical protein
VGDRGGTCRCDGTLKLKMMEVQMIWLLSIIGIILAGILYNLIYQNLLLHNQNTLQQQLIDSSEKNRHKLNDCFFSLEIIKRESLREYRENLKTIIRQLSLIKVEVEYFSELWQFKSIDIQTRVHSDILHNITDKYENKKYRAEKYNHEQTGELVELREKLREHVRSGNTNAIDKELEKLLSKEGISLNKK